MSRNVELSDDVYARIEAAASTTGGTVAEWIAAHAPKACVQPRSPESTTPGARPDENDDNPEGTLADEFKGLIGVVSLEETDLSERTGELFAEGMLEKYRSGRL